MLTEIHDYKIRPAEDHDLGMIAEILYRHYQAYDWWQAVNSEVEPTTWLRDAVSTMRDDSRKGTDGAWLFLEEGGVMAGALRYMELKRTLDSLPERDYLPGENAFEVEKLDSSSFKHEMVAKYNKVLCECNIHLEAIFRSPATEQHRRSFRSRYVPQGSQNSQFRRTFWARVQPSS